MILVSVAWDAGSLLLIHNVVANPVHAILSGNDNKIDESRQSEDRKQSK